MEQAAENKAWRSLTHEWMWSAVPMANITSIPRPKRPLPQHHQILQGKIKNPTKNNHQKRIVRDCGETSPFPLLLRDAQNLSNLVETVRNHRARFTRALTHFSRCHKPRGTSRESWEYYSQPNRSRDASVEQQQHHIVNMDQ